MKLRKHKMMFFMLRMLKQAVISTRLCDRFDKAIQSNVLMSLKQCESCYFAYMFFISWTTNREKQAFADVMECFPPCQSTYTSLTVVAKRHIWGELFSIKAVWHHAWFSFSFEQGTGEQCSSSFIFCIFHFFFLLKINTNYHVWQMCRCDLSTLYISKADGYLFND